MTPLIKVKSLGETSFKLRQVDVKVLPTCPDLPNDGQFTREVTLSNELILEAADHIRAQFREA